MFNIEKLQENLTMELQKACDNCGIHYEESDTCAQLCEKLNNN